MKIALQGDEIGKHLEIGQPSRHYRIGIVTTNTLVVVALRIIRLRFGQAFFRQLWMLPQERIVKRLPVPIILPARIRHHPVQVVEHPRNKKIGYSLCRCQRRIDRHAIFLRDVGKDGFAVADRVVAIDDVRQLVARSRRGVKNMYVLEGHAGELEECENLQAIAVVVCDTE